MPPADRRAVRPASASVVSAALAILVVGACGGGGPRPPSPPAAGAAADRVHPGGGTASAHPPGGLTPEQVPLFVQFGFDDNAISGRDGSGTVGGVRFVRELFEGRRNADGTPALFSFYATTVYAERAGVDRPEHVKREWRAVAEAGHEIGIHTHSHPHGQAFDTDAWTREIEACASWLTKPFDAARAADPEVGIGVPRTALSGFRAPFLEYDRPLFPALRTAGLLYDCSVQEGFDPRFDGTNLLWPYRLAGGPAEGTAGRAAGRELWELPVYVLIVPPDEECARYGVAPGLREKLHRAQAYFDPGDGKITGFDWNLWVELGMAPAEVVATFQYTLDQRLRGNRAPLTFGAHSDVYSDQYAPLPNSTAEQRRTALAEMLDYALARPEVRVVTARAIIDWLRAPRPAALPAG